MENAWILPFLEALEQAATMRLSARVREAHLSNEERERFERQEVPAITTHAEQVLERTRAAIVNWTECVVIPDWLDVQVTAILLSRYGFDSGGGPTRKVSRSQLKSLLNEPQRLADDLRKSIEPTKKGTVSGKAKPVRQRKAITALVSRIEAAIQPSRDRSRGVRSAWKGDVQR